MTSELRREFGHERTVCSCQDCINNCKFIPGFLIPADLDRLIPGDINSQDWARKHLRASPGAQVAKLHPGGTPEVFWIPTLVPAPSQGYRCHWLGSDNQCQIHENSPFGCAFFDCHENNLDRNSLSKRGLIEILNDFHASGPYSQLWNLLHSEGLTVVSVAVRLEALKRAHRPSRPDLKKLFKRK